MCRFRLRSYTVVAECQLEHPAATADGNIMPWCTAAGAASPASSIKSLWGSAGTFAGTSAASLGINDNMLQQLYGPEALKRARTWVQNKKMLWCGTANNPDEEPQDGVFPFEAAPTNSTSWPGACLMSAKAQELFDKGLAWRMLFNDNEATCAFRAAGRIAKDCAMAHLGAALSMGPNGKQCKQYPCTPALYIQQLLFLPCISLQTATHYSFMVFTAQPYHSTTVCMHPAPSEIHTSVSLWLHILSIISRHC